MGRDVSKFLCYVLRHRPEEIGVTLDPAGYVDAAELVRAMQPCAYLCGATAVT